MSSKVYMADLRTTHKNNLFAKLGRLLECLGLEERIESGYLTAIKLHFGEEGNVSFIRPVLVRPVVEMLRKLEARPFVTDTNTLYVGSRSDAVGHLETAIRHGFNFPVLGAPVLIADGLKGNSVRRVEIGLKHFKEVKIAAEIHNADALVVLSHFKGHELTGFGGALKNLGMGCAGREGKLAQHSNISPKVVRKRCVGCGHCLEWCPAGAIRIDRELGKAVIDNEQCVGCGECIVVCPQKAVNIRWNETVPVFQEKMMEYAYGACHGKRERCFFINFVLQVSPACDCYGHNDMPVVADIGILASRDPVALDQACADLVVAAPGMAGSVLGEQLAPGSDKFRTVYPEIEWRSQLAYAAKIGLGSRSYELERI
ncbi:MAG: DUF362 domain-containing protein [Deltaproteobacteria bacterium]|nr:DUF362 domain-containing protein [Deltaproteobacteria bacterium]